MHKSFLPILMLVFLTACLGKTDTQIQSKATAKTGIPDGAFSFRYSAVGLGSNFGKLQPVFTITGLQYIYTMQQTSFYNRVTIKPDTICTGLLPVKAIDSVVQIVNSLKEDSFYRCNPGIMSGGINYIYVSTKGKAVSFELFNAADTTAEKIVDIINHYIPADKDKLWFVITSKEEQEMNHRAIK